MKKRAKRRAIMAKKSEKAKNSKTSAKMANKQKQMAAKIEENEKYLQASSLSYRKRASEKAKKKS